MAGLIPLTPYISTIPEYVALSGQTSRPFTLTSNVEYGEIVLQVDGNPVVSTGLIEANTLMKRDFTTRWPLIRKNAKLYLVFTSVRNGYPRTVTIPMNFPKKRTNRKSGTSILVIPPDNPAYPSPVRKARSRAAATAKSSRRAARISVPKASTLRPSPETISIPFRRILEDQSPDPPFTYTVLTDTVVPMVAFERVWSGTRTPNFGALRKGQLPVNPHSVTIKEVLSNKLLHGSRRHTGPGYNSWVRLFTEIYAEPPIPGHIDLARFNALRRLIDAAELGIEANLAQDLAQMNQTFNLIGNCANRIYRSMRALKRGDIPSAARELTHGRRSNNVTPHGRPSVSKSLADNWLELQYGWKPLLGDIEGTLKSMANLHTTDLVQRVAVSGKAKTDSVTRQLSQYGGAVAPGLQVTTKVVSETKCKFTLRFKLASPLRAFAAQTGFTNPINLAWEILPFSFVVDWFLPIGPYLEAFTAFDGLEFVDGSQTLFTRSETDTAVDSEGPNALNSLSDYWEHGHYHSKTIRLDRIKLTAFPTPTFPSLKNGLASVTHAANAIALVKSVFTK